MKKMSMFFLTNFDIEFFQEKLCFYEIYEELRYFTTILFPSLLVVQKIASQLWTSPAAIICRRGMGGSGMGKPCICEYFL